ncbi:hypothetical protein SpCBS45565_g00514 [Spizellomyces sp. 'palustris']|nr:hypothetical protein SpCBS45565_g00514 [Spizellomyces sp. 'palustris']
MQSRFFDDRSRRGSMFGDPYGRGYPSVPASFDERDYRPAAGWGGPPVPMGPPQLGPPQMPFYGGGGQTFFASGYPGMNMGFAGGPERFGHPVYETQPTMAPYSGSRPTMRSGYGPRYELEVGRDQLWERERERDRGRPSNYNAPLLDFPPDPDVRGFEEYKLRWDQTTPKPRETSVQGWGPPPQIKYDPLLMWSREGEPSRTSSTTIPSPARDTQIKIEQSGDKFRRLYDYPEYVQERFEVTDAHVPPAYHVSETDIPPNVGPIGTHGRANADRDRSLSPVQTYTSLKDEYSAMRYKRENR